MASLVILMICAVCVYSEEPETANDNQFHTTTPITLFTKSKIATISNNERSITATKDGWINIGFDYVINPDESIILSTMTTFEGKSRDESLNIMIGFATKDLIYSIDDEISKHKNSWCYKNNGFIYSDGKRVKFVQDYYAKQRMRITYHNNKISIFILGVKVETINVFKLFNKASAYFYPVISFNGKGTKVRILEFKVIKQGKDGL